MNDYNDINPGSRRGPQGPDPEPPPDESNLKRAISCESVCSDTSVVLNDLEEAPVVGHVCVGVQYDRWGGRGADSEGDLAVSVLEARDLVTSDGQPAQDTFARFEHFVKLITFDIDWINNPTNEIISRSGIELYQAKDRRNI